MTPLATVGYITRYLAKEVAPGDLAGIAVTFTRSGGVVVSVHRDDAQLVLRLLDLCSLAVDDASDATVLSCGTHVVGFARHTPGSLRTDVELDWYVDDAALALAELADYAGLIEYDAALVGA